MNQSDESDLDEPLPEYDFSDAVQGMIHKRLQGETEKQPVLLDRDVYDIFRDSKSVNDALRLLIKVGRESIAAKQAG